MNLTCMVGVKFCIDKS